MIVSYKYRKKFQFLLLNAYEKHAVLMGHLTVMENAIDSNTLKHTVEDTLYLLSDVLKKRATGFGTKCASSESVNKLYYDYNCFIQWHHAN